MPSDSTPAPLVKLCILLCLVVFVCSAAAATRAAPPSTAPLGGLRDHTPAVHALTGGRIVVAPGRILEKGMLVIRDGYIEAVGADVKPPADARLWDLTGKTVYAGLIDAYSETSLDKEAAKKGAPYWNDHVTPQLSVANQFKPDQELNKKLRSQGVTARLVAPDSGVIKGTSAVVTTGEGNGDRSIIKENAALHMRLTSTRGGNRYPKSPMGAVALARQAVYDARWYQEAWRAYRANHNVPRPERNDALASLGEFDDAERLVIIDAPNELYFLRADRYAREFNLNVAVRGSGDEYRRLDDIAQCGRPVIVSLQFPEAPNVATAEAALSVSLERMLDWDHAPENPARLERAGVTIVLTGHGLKDPGELLTAVRTAIKRGLPAEDALRALTTSPAKLLGVDRRLGTLEVGRIANVIVASGDLFDEKTNVLETWVHGRRYEIKRQPLIDARGEWTVTLGEPADEIDERGDKRDSDKKAKIKKRQPDTFLARVTGSPDKPKGVLLTGKDHDAEITLDHLSLRGSRLTANFTADEFHGQGVAQLSAVISLKEENATWHGGVTWADGTSSPLVAMRVKTFDKIESDEPDEDVQVLNDEEDENEQQKDDGSDEESVPRKKADIDRTASFEVNYPLGAFGAVVVPKQSGAVLFKDATVWTSSQEGTLKRADVLIEKGFVLRVGKGIDPPDGATVIDCKGKHITPGIIDCHSHMATDGGVNESSQTVTAEVRIGDFIDSDDITIYRQLAGGVTASNILHGSANTIGGQNQVIKLRWGAIPDKMKMTEAPQGIKFALGENVKQSNWGEKFTSRYPQTRMGVEQIVRDEFEAAKAYQQEWDNWQRHRKGAPPRRDLELDAIVEVLQGKRWIHCHSYRQDEILALMRTLDLYGVTIGSFQHILEGYKVAKEMAEHGATGSAFSDWWAYKFEVYDAIPYNGALMHQAGVVVSFNSDDHEMGRHLNHEAAKAVKYGGVPPAEALKFVTLNPAIQLRIDKWVGSLEPGKHADLVVWSGDPLSVFSRCEQTWIDGRKYFDRQDDQARRRQVQKMRAALVQKILASGEKMAKEEDDSDKQDAWLPRSDIFCGCRWQGIFGKHE